MRTTETIVSKFLPPGLSLGLVLGLLLGAFPALATATGDRVTIGVCCDTGVVDQHWRVTVEVTDADGNVQGSVTQRVPKHTTSKAAAKGLAYKISEKFGVTATTAKSAPMNDKGEPIQLYDLVLPAGLCIGKVKTEKKVGKTWKPRNGHLKLFRNGERIKTKRQIVEFRDSVLTHEEVGAESATGDRQSRAGVGGGEVAPLEESEGPFTGLTVQLGEYDVDPLVLVMHLEGVGVDGDPVEYAYEESFPAETPPEEALAHLADFAQSLGMAADLPAPDTLTLYFGAGGEEIYFWRFAAGASNGSCVPDEEEDEIIEPPIYFGTTYSATAF